MHHLRVAGFVVTAAILVSCKQQASQDQKAADSKKGTGVPVVSVATVISKQLTRSVDTVGTLFPLEEVVVSAEVDGRVLKVNYDLGDNIAQGAVLVEISPEEQQYVLAQNEAQLRQSLERLGLKDEADRVTDLDTTPEVRRAKADMADAEQRYRRVRTLFEQKIGSEQDLDQATTRVSSMQAALDASRMQARNLIQDVDRFKALVNLQRKKLRDTSVLAPFAGSIKEKQVNTGQFVRANTALFTMVRTNPVRLRLEIPERMAPWIREGQIADVSVEAFQDRIFKGVVKRISPTVDQSKRTFIVEAEIANPDGALKPGSYARAKMPTRKIDEMILVPSRAVAYVLGSNKAYVVKDGVVEARDVTLGDRFETEVEIIDGLQVGETVAASGLNRLDAGVKVRIGEPKGEGGRGGSKK